jgi:geranylgeranyl transferase type-2 subunit beta
MDFGRLLGRVVAAAAEFPDQFRDRHAGYLLRAEHPQGGFGGRTGQVDSYYTAFGLAGLALLGRLPEPIVHRALDVLFPPPAPADDPNRAGSGPHGRAATLPELVGLVACRFFGQGIPQAFPDASVPQELAGPEGQDPFGRWGLSAQQAAEEFLGLVRRPDGGYAKHPASPTSSTYATFLGALVQQWVGLPLLEPDKTAQMLLARQRDDGGFAEWPSVRQSGVNPTAAAVGWYSLANRMPVTVRDRTAAYLASMQTPEGGFRAHGRLPMADLLSTFTGLVALELLGAAEAVDRQAARQYILRLELPTGGFRAAVWDTTADVEYTFYGLAGLALLADAAGG